MENKFYLKYNKYFDELNQNNGLFDSSFKWVEWIENDFIQINILKLIKILKRIEISDLSNLE